MKDLVLDANILIRAALGASVMPNLILLAPSVRFWAPDAAVLDARRHLPRLAQKRSLDQSLVDEALQRTERLVDIVDAEYYAAEEQEARRRLMRRDESDWPILASALALRCGLWTEDSDFFGVGIVTWTTKNVARMLADAEPAAQA